MVVRSLRPIEPSADFEQQLARRLREARLVAADDLPTRTWSVPRTLVAACCALLIGVGIRALMVHRIIDASVAPQPAIASKPSDAAGLPDAAIAAAIPGGIPVWSAMMTAGQLPAQLVTVDFVESATRR